MGASGMSLRDYFAGQALTSVLSDKDTMTALNTASEKKRLEGDVIALAATLAYLYADAMLVAREKSTP